jgi:hypothetical protein
MRVRTIQYDDPVTLKDIEAEINYAQEGMENFTEFYYRLSHQNAPLELVAEMATAAQLYQQIQKRLEALTACFPRG